MNQDELKKLTRKMTITEGDAFDFIESFSKSSQSARRSGLKKFAVFKEVNNGDASEVLNAFLQEHIEDRALGVNDTKHFGEKQISKFLQWLKTMDYSAQSLRAAIYSVGALCSWKHKTLEIDWNRVPDIPPATKTEIKNIKYVWPKDHVERALGEIKNNRDKAIFLVLFQAAPRMSDICKLDYDHIANDYEENKIPVMIGPFHTEKTDQETFTFLLPDTIYYLRQYESERGGFRRGEPLFTTKAGERISKNYIARFMNRLAHKLANIGLISKERLESASMNPFGAHSFRTTFETHMTNAGMNEKYINFFMAHEPSGTGAQSYFKPTRQQAEKVYMKFTDELRVNAKFAEIAYIQSEGLDKINAQGEDINDVKQIIAKQAQMINLLLRLQHTDVKMSKSEVEHEVEEMNLDALDGMKQWNEMQAELHQDILDTIEMDKLAKPPKPKKSPKS